MQSSCITSDCAACCTGQVISPLINTHRIVLNCQPMCTTLLEFKPHDTILISSLARDTSNTLATVTQLQYFRYSVLTHASRIHIQNSLFLHPEDGYVLNRALSIILLAKLIYTLILGRATLNISSVPTSTNKHTP